MAAVSVSPAAPSPIDTCRHGYQILTGSQLFSVCTTGLQKSMGKNWGRLHKLVYISAIVAFIHVLQYQWKYPVRRQRGITSRSIRILQTKGRRRKRGL